MWRLLLATGAGCALLVIPYAPWVGVAGLLLAAALFLFLTTP